jgi:hypothetical protein
MRFLPMSLGVVVFAGIMGLLAGPVLAQSDGWRRDRPDHHREHAERYRHGGDAYRPGEWRPIIPPAVVLAPGVPLYGPPGPAPTGFWYLCGAPTGYYPMVQACRMPWRRVAGGYHR